MPSTPPCSAPDAQYFQPELEAVQDIRKILIFGENEELLHFYVVFLQKIVSDSAPRSLLILK
jgi:hypothetical protein